MYGVVASDACNLLTSDRVIWVRFAYPISELCDD